MVLERRVAVGDLAVTDLTLVEGLLGQELAMLLAVFGGSHGVGVAEVAGHQTFVVEHFLAEGALVLALVGPPVGGVTGGYFLTGLVIFDNGQGRGLKGLGFGDELPVVVDDLHFVQLFEVSALRPVRSGH